MSEMALRLLEGWDWGRARTRVSSAGEPAECSSLSASEPVSLSTTGDSVEWTKDTLGEPDCVDGVGILGLMGC